MSRRNTVLVTYDVGDPKRLQTVYKTLRGFGDHLQLSVFLCQLTRRERIQLEALLEEIIHQDDDQVLFVDIGPTDGRAKESVKAMGKRYVHPERVAIVL